MRTLLMPTLTEREGNQSSCYSKSMSISTGWRQASDDWHWRTWKRCLSGSWQKSVVKSQWSGSSAFHKVSLQNLPTLGELSHFWAFEWEQMGLCSTGGDVGSICTPNQTYKEFPQVAGCLSMENTVSCLGAASIVCGLHQKSQEEWYAEWGQMHQWTTCL